MRDSVGSKHSYKQNSIPAPVPCSHSCMPPGYYTSLDLVTMDLWVPEVSRQYMRYSVVAPEVSR